MTHKRTSGAILHITLHDALASHAESGTWKQKWLFHFTFKANMQLPLSKTMMDPAASALIVRVWHPSNGVPITRSPEQHTKGP